MGGRAVGCRERAFFFPTTVADAPMQKERTQARQQATPPRRGGGLREAASAMAEQRVSTVVFALLQYL